MNPKCAPMLITLTLILLLAFTGSAYGIAVTQTAVAQSADGRLQLFGIDTTNQLWSCWKQTTDINSPWTNWSKFTMPPVAGIKQISVAQSADGRLQLFAIGIQYQLWSCWKQTTDINSPWTNWSKFTMPPVAGIKQISLAQSADRRLQLFAIDLNNQLWCCWKQTTDINSPWTNWTKQNDSTEQLTPNGTRFQPKKMLLPIYMGSDSNEPANQDSLFEEGNTYYTNGEYQKAIDCYDQVIKLNLQLYEAQYNKGLALCQLGEYQAAISAFDQALNICPDCKEAQQSKDKANQALQNTSS